MVEEEGLENAWLRHQEMHKILAEGLEELGLSFVVENENERLPQLNTVRLREGIDEKTVRGRLLEEYNLEIGAGLGPFAGNVWRIGLMGYSARKENVELCLSALRSCL